MTQPPCNGLRMTQPPRDEWFVDTVCVIEVWGAEDFRLRKWGATGAGYVCDSLPTLEAAKVAAEILFSSHQA